MSDAGAWLTAALGVLSVVLIPLLVIAYRVVIKWTRMESNLGAISADVRELVTTRDATQREMLEQMRHDREATDKRLRYLEEYWMQKGRDHAGEDPQERRR